MHRQIHALSKYGISPPPEKATAAARHPHGYRSALAPLRNKAGLWAKTLGTWPVGSSDYALEQFLFVGPRGGGDYFRIGIFAGLHGDETAGIHAAVRFLQELAAQPELARGYEVYVYPLVNPTGFEDGTRRSRSGHDLNREFWTGSSQPEVQLLEAQIRGLRLDGIISLHADDSSEGLYAFVLGAEIARYVVEPALLEAEKILPVNHATRIDNFTAKNGLIRKGYPGMLSGEPGARPQAFEIVLETPQLAELELQVEANLVALHTILDQYQQLRALAQDL